MKRFFRRCIPLAIVATGLIVPGSALGTTCVGNIDTVDAIQRDSSLLVFIGTIQELRDGGGLTTAADIRIDTALQGDVPRQVTLRETSPPAHAPMSELEAGKRYVLAAEPIFADDGVRPELSIDPCVPWSRARPQTLAVVRARGREQGASGSIITDEQFSAWLDEQDGSDEVDEPAGSPVERKASRWAQVGGVALVLALAGAAILLVRHRRRRSSDQ